MTSETDIFFLRQAYRFALNSLDPSTQNGAVVIPNGCGRHDPLYDFASGWNQFYDGVPEEYENKTIKYQGIEHAERDAIFKAARFGVICQGATLYCPWVACRECARAILGIGITRVVFHADRLDIINTNWENSIDDAFVWLNNRGIELHAHRGPVPNVQPILVSGRSWSPSELAYVGEQSSV
jgi:dCMP deaminase